MTSQITSLTIVYSTVYLDADQRKHQSSASLAFVWGIHRGPVNSPHKWPVTRKTFPFHDVIMCMLFWIWMLYHMSISWQSNNCIPIYHSVIACTLRGSALAECRTSTNLIDACNWPKHDRNGKETPVYWRSEIKVEYSVNSHIQPNLRCTKPAWIYKLISVYMWNYVYTYT